MYAAGLRVSELVNLKQAEVDIHSGVINCHGKGSKERRVPVGKSAIHWLQQYLSIKASYGRPAYPNLFLHRGKPLTRQLAWSMIKTYAEQVGLQNVSPHTLRHSFATHSVAARRRLAFGAGAAWTQRYLDHANLHTHHGSTSAQRLRQPSSARAPRGHAKEIGSD